jgi:NCS1 family nucleobase:cation symporter-1
MCYFIYWFIQFPFMFVTPQKLRYLFHVKAIIVPVAWMAIFIWAMVKVPPSASLDPKHTLLTGSQLSWAWLSALNSALGIYATLAVNIPDFTRYAKTEKAQYVQMAIIPVAFTLTSFMGIAVTSVGEVLYGETIWDPLRLVDRWDNRAATFFAAFSFALATLGSNISANSLSAANDLTVLWPRYINIKRGQAICAVIGGLALCPWEILATATGFLSFMNGYTVFLGPFAGIMVVDYWILHRGKVDVPAMYDPHGRYRYWRGVNWRALAALVASVPPLLPGLISSINSSVHVSNAMRLFDIAWIYGFFMASFIYFITSKFFPAAETFLEAAILTSPDLELTQSIDAKDSVSDMPRV